MIFRPRISYFSFEPCHACILTYAVLMPLILIETKA